MGNHGVGSADHVGIIGTMFLSRVYSFFQLIICCEEIMSIPLHKHKDETNDEYRQRYEGFDSLGGDDDDGSPDGRCADTSQPGWRLTP